MSHLITASFQGHTSPSDFGELTESFSIDWSAVAHDLNAAETANGVKFETLWTIILKYVTYTGPDAEKQEATRELNESIQNAIKKISPSSGT